MTGHADASRLTQTSMVGGSSEGEIAEVAVSPVLTSPEPAVITLTPPMRCRIACLNVASSWAAVGIFRSAIVIARAPRVRRSASLPRAHDAEPEDACPIGDEKPRMRAQA